MICPKVEQFWAYYSYMARPGDLPGNSNIHLFKHGIRPMWEVSFNFAIIITRELNIMIWVSMMISLDPVV